MGCSWPNQPDGEAFRNHARGTIGMQPWRREARLGRETIEVSVADLKAREYLLDDAFHVVELDGRAGEARSPRESPAAANASAGRSSTFSVVPLKTVPNSKRRTSLTSRLRLPATAL